MATLRPRYSKEEVARRGDAIFQEKILPKLNAKDRGKFLALSLAEPTCRPDENWQKFAPESFEKMRDERTAALRAWSASLHASGLGGEALLLRLGEAGALGLLVSLRPSLTPSPGWGTSKIGTASTDKVPEVGLSCEDYGLVRRLAERNQGPVIRLDAPARFEDEVPVFNVIAELRGSLKDQSS